MRKKYVTMSDAMANAAAILVIPFVAVACVIATNLYGMDLWKNSGNLGTIAACFAALVAIIPHELLHAFGWMVCGKSRKELHFGYRFPICAFTQFDGTMSKGAFAFGCILPFVITALIPLFVGAVVGSFNILIFGVLESVGCGSDILSFVRALVLVRKNELIGDEKGITGFVVLS